jgi:hypothetical protein
MAISRRHEALLRSKPSCPIFEHSKILTLRSPRLHNWFPQQDALYALPLGP